MPRQSYKQIAVAVALTISGLTAVNASAQVADTARVVSTDFKDPKDCNPAELCKTLKVGDVLKVSGKVLIDGRDFAIASLPNNAGAVTILASMLAFEGVEAVPPSNMPVIKPSPGTEKSSVVITPDTDVDYK